MDSKSLEQQLRRHVYCLAQEIGERNIFNPTALGAAADYIRDVWRGQGYEVREQAYTVKGVRSANLEVTCRGSQHPDEIILIGAHYDSVLGSPGANDNASGVASLLALSSQLTQLQPERTLRFVAFVNEESPFFFTRRQGSRVYARAAHAQGDDIRLMIALETMGYYRGTPRSRRYPPLFRLFYPSRANFIAFVSNFRSRTAMRKLASAFRQATRFPMQHIATFATIPGVAWSDHLSFWFYRYKALMVTDTAFYRYPYYHTAQDTPEKLDYTRLAQVTEGLLEALLTLSRQGV